MDIIFAGKHSNQLVRLRKIFHEAGGVERAANLIEHYWEVGYDHLVPAHAKYNWSWIQYYNVDVKTTLLLILVLSGYVTLRLLRCVCRCFSAKVKHKED